MYNSYNALFQNAFLSSLVVENITCLKLNSDCEMYNILVDRSFAAFR